MDVPSFYINQFGDFCYVNKYQIDLMFLYLGLIKYSSELFDFLRKINVDMALDVGRTYYFNAL